MENVMEGIMYETEVIGNLRITTGIHESISDEMVLDMMSSTTTGDFVIPSDISVEIICSEGNGDLHFEVEGIQHFMELTRGSVIRLKSEWPYKTRFCFRASDLSDFSVLLKFTDSVDVCLKDSPKWFGESEVRRESIKKTIVQSYP